MRSAIRKSIDTLARHPRGVGQARPRRTLRWILALAAAVLVIALPRPALTAPPALAPILLKNGHLPADVGMSSQARDALSRALEARAGAPGGARVHALVQLDYLPSESDKQRLQASGLRLLSYIPERAWVASFDAATLDRALTLPGVARIEVLTTQHKLAPAIAAGQFGSHSLNAAGIANLVVQFHEDVTLDAGETLLRARGAEPHSRVPAINAFVVRLPRAAIADLAGEDEVKWIEPVLPPFGHANETTRGIIGANALQTTPYNLDGSGITAMVYDADMVYEHDDLLSPRVVRAEPPLKASSSDRLHATHVTGTLAGSGYLENGRYRGMAPNANIAAYWFCCVSLSGWLYSDPGDLQANYQSALTTYNVDVANNSISTNIARSGQNCALEGDYHTTSQLIDSIVRGSLGKPLPLVWAAGNERGDGRCGTTYYTVPPPAGAKNVIAVGAVDATDAMSSFSSWGPTDDGRLHPTLVAPGVSIMSTIGSKTDFTQTYGLLSGTSMATPAVTGSVALFLQQYKITFPGSVAPLPSTVRAYLVNSAVDLGSAGPDYAYGYGRLNARAAVDQLRERLHHEDVALTPTQVREYQVTAFQGQSELKVTLAWDDVPGNVLAAKELINDLDLELVSPNGTRQLPWLLDPVKPSDPAKRGVDRLNTIEQVRVANPLPGTWIVRVKVGALPQGPQSYSIVASPYAIDKNQFPTVSGFTPTVRNPNTGSSTFVYVFGSKFVAGKTQVTINGLTVPLVQILSDSLLVFVLPTTGNVNGFIKVYTPGGFATSSTEFGKEITQLTITGVSPSQARPGQIVFVFGARFVKEPLGSTRLSLNGQQVFALQIIDSSLLAFLVPSTAKTGIITVTTPEASVSLPSKYIIIQPPPTVTAFNPLNILSAATGTERLISLTGTNFYDPVGVSFNGLAAVTFGATSPTTMDVLVPIGATTGPVCVTTPGGSGCSSTNFVVN